MDRPELELVAARDLVAAGRLACLLCFDGMASQAPVPTGSVVDVTFFLELKILAEYADEGSQAVQRAGGASRRGGWRCRQA